MRIEKANTDDHQILTKITKKSKVFWGYSEEQMAQWNDTLTITKEYIKTNFAFKLIKENQVIGYYSYFNTEKTIIKLDNLFILPQYIGKGFGNYLMDDFLIRIKENRDIKKIILDADPNAEKFYQKFGFETIGQLETSIKNRFLPVMELKFIKPL
ncbi:GNAT family N-acetyltransferase [Flavobacterium sp.]|uniref:GNAT family N-acetyltransferase n=1 Tax=Flavobacterium sp. TaxID=239 RepID=UPI0037512D91